MGVLCLFVFLFFCCVLFSFLLVYFCFFGAVYFFNKRGLLTNLLYLAGRFSLQLLLSSADLC